MPRAKEIKTNEIAVSIARAKSAVLMARTYISKQPGSTVAPLLNSLVEIIEQQVAIINSTATGDKP